MATLKETAGQRLILFYLLCPFVVLFVYRLGFNDGKLVLIATVLGH